MKALEDTIDNEDSNAFIQLVLDRLLDTNQNTIGRQWYNHFEIVRHVVTFYEGKNFESGFRQNQLVFLFNSLCDYYLVENNDINKDCIIYCLSEISSLLIWMLFFEEQNKNKESYIKLKSHIEKLLFDDENGIFHAIWHDDHTEDQISLCIMLLETYSLFFKREDLSDRYPSFIYPALKLPHDTFVDIIGLSNYIDLESSYSEIFESEKRKQLRGNLQETLSLMLGKTPLIMAN
jgi:hypothetical protein